MDTTHWLATAIRLACESASIIKEASKTKKSIECKQNPSDLVTQTDKQVETFISTQLKALYPTHMFIGEETSALNGDKSVGTLPNEPTWIIDPVDGTTNFIHGFPFFCVSIGLTLKGKPWVGVVYNVALDKLYYAANGHGAYLIVNPKEPKIGDGVKLGQVLSNDVYPQSLSQALVCTEYGSSKDPAHLGPKFEILQKLVNPPVAARGVRSLGSAALSLCLIAECVVDVYYEAGIHSWDICAGVVIVTESGGHVANWVDKDEFDLLDRTCLAIRAGYKDLSLAGQLQSIFVPIPYERD